MARTLHWMLALSVTAAWLTGRSGPDGLRHVAAGALVALLLAATLAKVLRAGLGPTRKAAVSAVIGLLLLGVLAVTGAIVLAGEERWAPWLVGVGTGVRVHAVHDVAATALLAWVGVHLAGAVLHWRGRPPSIRLEALATALAIATTLAGTSALALALASTPPDPAVDPRWETECGDCHLAYPPDLLPARSWERMMAGSSDHFGEDLALAPETSAALLAFAVAHAAETDATEHAWRVHHSVPAGDAPQRITELDWWARVHADVPEAAFEHPDVRNRGRCQACHPDAASGAFQAPITKEKRP